MLRHALLIATVAVLPAAAQPTAGLGRMHGFKQWNLGCDNTARCEAQGYHAGADDLPAVLLVQRDPGPGAPMRMRIGFGEADPVRAPVTLRAGTLRQALSPPGADGFIDLAPAQVAELLPWLLKAEAVQLAAGKEAWTISLAGASAALLKMDDLQGRVGTPGALVRRGTRREAVLRTSAPPVVAAAVVPLTRPEDTALAARIRPAIQGAGDACPLMAGPDAAAREGQVVRLSATRVMVVFECWQAAYQAGSAAWTANDRPPFAPQPVRFQRAEDGADEADQPTMLDLSRDDAGRLTAHAAAKGRGIGDCWSTQDWVWDGRRFALTEATLSPCRSYAAGGQAVTLWRAVVR